MGLFATEFPVAPSVTKAKFLATAVGWARGMTSSSLKIDEKSFQNYGDEIVFKGDGGEIFFIKELATSDGFVIGARHDLVDAGSRNWRTECVLTNRGSSASLRVRGQCLTGNYEVVPVIPKKPFFIKACLEDGWGANGGIFNVTDSPIFLTSQIDIAAKIAMGGYESTLPTIYLSTQDNGSTLLDPKKLAYDLGGIAHILVEIGRAHV